MEPSPNFLRESPKLSSDALSDVLSLLNARSVLSTGMVIGGDWALRFNAFASIKFNVVVRGSCWLTVECVDAPVHLKAGDCFMLTKGRPFGLASSLDIEPIEARSVFTSIVDGVARSGDKDDVFIIGGRVMLEEADAALLLDALPPLIHVRGRSEQADVLRWLLERLTGELADHRPGGTIMATHLVHMMFVQVLRVHLDATERGTTGWLAALSDRRLGEALRQIHAAPSRRWTLTDLADAAGMSRSNFALRFKETLGVAPLDYVLRWRMRLAGQALRQETGSVSAIAQSLGYESESAFSNAFKRVMGSAPMRYRHERRSTAPAQPLWLNVAERTQTI
jgi:AraC-like DNA-binding protein